MAHVSRTFANNRNNITIEMDNCIRVLNFEVHQTCTGTKKTQVLNFKVHQTCTGTKKTKVLNFKVHQTCTGTKKTKKTKTFQSTWEGASTPVKFLFFLSLCRFGLAHFEVQNLCFFVPVQVWCGSSLAAFLFDMCLRNRHMDFLLQLAKPKSPNMAQFQA